MQGGRDGVHNRRAAYAGGPSTARHLPALRAPTTALGFGPNALVRYPRRGPFPRRDRTC